MGRSSCVYKTFIWVLTADGCAIAPPSGPFTTVCTLVSVTSSTGSAELTEEDKTNGEMVGKFLQFLVAFLLPLGLLLALVSHALRSRLPLVPQRAVAKHPLLFPLGQHLVF